METLFLHKMVAFVLRIFKIIIYFTEWCTLIDLFLVCFVPLFACGSETRVVHVQALHHTQAYVSIASNQEKKLTNNQRSTWFGHPVVARCCSDKFETIAQHIKSRFIAAFDRQIQISSQKCEFMVTSRWITDKIYLHLYKNNNFFPKYFNNTDFEILFLIYPVIFYNFPYTILTKNKSKENKDHQYQQVFITEPFYIDTRLNSKSRTTFMGLKINAQKYFF